MNENEPKEIKIQPPKFNKKEAVEEGSPKAKSVSKTLFRKSMGADAILFRTPRNEESANPSTSQGDAPPSESSTDAATSNPEPGDVSLIERIPAKAFLAVITGILLLFGFFVGRCSTPSSSSPQAIIQNAKPAVRVEWIGKFREGLTALKEGNTAKVSAIADELAALPQKDAYYPAGWLYTQAKNSERAITVLDKISPDEPHASDAAILEAIIALKASAKSSLVPKARNAETLFQKAITIDPLNVEAHVLYGVFLRAQGRNQSAVEQFQDAILFSRSSDTGFVYRILLKLAENDLNGPPTEAPKNPDLGDQIITTINLWRKGTKGDAVTQLRQSLSVLPPAVQRTLLQDPAFRELPGGTAEATPAPKESAPVATPTPSPTATPPTPKKSR
ncbi:MAG: tetratricopeptide repeat protein [Chthoniobacterales bacterium]